MLTQICVALWRDMSKHDKCASINASVTDMLLTLTTLIITTLSAKHIWEMFVHSWTHCVLPFCCIVTHLFRTIILIFTFSWIHVEAICTSECTAYFFACTHTSLCYMDVQICSHTSWCRIPSGARGCDIHTMQMPWLWRYGVCGSGLKQHFHTAVASRCHVPPLWYLSGNSNIWGLDPPGPASDADCYWL